ncbi:hypothetical protein [Streptomyces olivaceoviridis]|uniref:hypothetical protein n=1 Tax=Streptomyces olivaceoviridis TaxID=1921 RepID=UPI0036746BF0
MSVVVPVSDVGAVALPVLVGVAFLGERPAAVAWAGIAVAVPAPWLVAQAAGPGTERRSATLGMERCDAGPGAERRTDGPDTGRCGAGPGGAPYRRAGHGALWCRAGHGAP